MTIKTDLDRAAIEQGFRQITAFQCTSCGQVFEDPDEAADCIDSRCPHPRAVAWRDKLRALKEESKG